MFRRMRAWLDRRALRRYERRAVKRHVKQIARGEATAEPEKELLVDMLCRFEGYRSNAYLCPAKVWTIGYGSTRMPSGRPVMEGDNITKTTARRLLADHTATALGEARRLLADATVAPSIGCTAAVASLIYNVGPLAVAKSRFLAAWRAGDMKTAETEYIDFNKVGGKPVRGLTLRREAEWAILTGRA